jgi:membrane associated rhomboid family serine protease
MNRKPGPSSAPRSPAGMAGYLLIEVVLILILGWLLLSVENTAVVVGGGILIVAALGGLVGMQVAKLRKS